MEAIQRSESMGEGGGGGYDVAVIRRPQDDGWRTQLPFGLCWIIYWPIGKVSQAPLTIYNPPPFSCKQLVCFGSCYSTITNQPTTTHFGV